MRGPWSVYLKEITLSDRIVEPKLFTRQMKEKKADMWFPAYLSRGQESLLTLSLVEFRV